MWFYLIVLIVMLIVSIAMMPKAPSGQKPPALSDFDVPTAEDGRQVQMIFGTHWIDDPNVIWYGDLRTRPITSKGGGK